MIVGVVHGCSAAKTVLHERMAAATAYCEMFELRLDTMPDFVDAWDDETLDAPRPLIVTYRSHAEPGGMGTLSETSRRDLLNRLAQHPAVRWIDAEFSDLDTIHVPDGTGLLASIHLPEAAPQPDREGLLDKAADAKARGAGAFKFVVPARSLDEVLLVWDVVAAAPLPSIGIASGPMGELSRILYRRIGSPWTYGPLPGEAPPAGADGQVAVDTLALRYRASAVGPHWNIYGVLGNPVAQSRGVRRHNAAFRALSLAKVYVPLLAPSDDLSCFWRLAARLPMSGFSVTAPFKQLVMDGVTRIDAEAREIGAINTVMHAESSARFPTPVDAISSNSTRFVMMGHRSPESQRMPAPDATSSPPRRWHGFNADLPGLLAPLADEILDGKRALVLGAGGTARTAVVALRSRGVREIVLANRTVARAQAIAESLATDTTRVTGCALDAITSDAFDLVVNTTTVGMTGNEDAMPIEPAAVTLSDGALVYDVIYSPAPTRLLREFQARGVRTLDGRAMYEAQSNLQFRNFAEADFPAINPDDEV